MTSAVQLQVKVNPGRRSTRIRPRPRANSQRAVTSVNQLRGLIVSRMKGRPIRAANPKDAAGQLYVRLHMTQPFKAILSALKTLVDRGTVIVQQAEHCLIYRLARN